MKNLNNNISYDINCNHITYKIKDNLNNKNQNKVFYIYTLALAICLILTRIYN